MEADKQPTQTLSQQENDRQPKEELVLPEMVDGVKAEQDLSIDANVLLVQVFKKGDTTHEIVEGAERILKMIRRFDIQRSEARVESAEAGIRLRAKDPDAIEDRRDRRARRIAQYFVAACTVLCVVGGAITALLGESPASTTVLLISACLGMGILGPLGGNQPITSSDIVRMISALRRFIRPNGNDVTDKEEGGRR